MSEAQADEQVDHYVVDGVLIERHGVHASMSDGAFLFGYRYERTLVQNRSRIRPSQTPLLCLPTELGNSREHHDFALRLLTHREAPRRIYTLDLRGRGRSAKAPTATSDAQSDATDLISFCDAMGLHHCDVIVNGRGIAPAMLAAPARPALVRKLVLNDAAPEFDSVGIARLATVGKRIRPPRSWDEATASLKESRSVQFPVFDQKDWDHLAQIIWRDDAGKPVPDFASGLYRASNSTDLDQKQPRYWSQFRLFLKTPVLLVHGANSPLVNSMIIEKLEMQHPELKLIAAAAQGHVPQLHRGDLHSKILDFLIK